VRIISESSVSAGVRRIVALTGEAAVEYTLHRDAILTAVATRLRVGVDEVPERVERLAGARKQGTPRGIAAPDAVGRAALPDGTPYLAARSVGDAGALRAQAVELAAAIGGPVVLAADDEGQGRVVVVVPRAVSARFDAAVILGRLLPMIDGRGGGKASLAMGGGPKVIGLQAVLDAVPEALAS
jgi:alanyl-tRNA synthetase